MRPRRFFSVSWDNSVLTVWSQVKLIPHFRRRQDHLPTTQAMAPGHHCGDHILKGPSAGPSIHQILGKMLRPRTAGGESRQARSRSLLGPLGLAPGYGAVHGQRHHALPCGPHLLLRVLMFPRGRAAGVGHWLSGLLLPPKREVAASQRAGRRTGVPGTFRDPGVSGDSLGKASLPHGDGGSGHVPLSGDIWGHPARRGRVCPPGGTRGLVTLTMLADQTRR